MYRGQRREILKNIITLSLAGEAIHKYIRQQTLVLIPENDQNAFIKTIFEDLDMLAPSRIAGLGITHEQLVLWQKLQERK